MSGANICEWRSAGAAGFGISSALYKAGGSAETVSAKADAFCALLNCNQSNLELLPNGSALTN
jgi:hypothetical protein